MSDISISFEQSRPPQPFTMHDCYDMLMKAPIGTFVSTTDGRFLDVNPALAHLYGYDSVEEILGAVHDIGSQLYVDPADRENFIQQLTEHGQLTSYECRHRRRDGSIFWGCEYVQAVRDPAGNITHLQGFTVDITDHRQAEKDLQDNQQRINSILRSAPIGIGFAVDRIIKQVNPRLCEITGYSPEELIGQNSQILYQSEEDYCRVAGQKYQQIYEQGTSTVETRWRRKNGRIIDVLLRSTPIEPGDLAKGVTFSAQDVTERKRSEAELQQSKVKLTNYANQMEQFSLSAASMISLKDENLIFAKISKAIVDYSDFRRVLISLFKEEPPYRDLIGYAGISPETVDRLRRIPLPKSWYDRVFREGIHLGQFSFYIPHTMKDLVSQDNMVLGGQTCATESSAWHPKDNLFVRLNDEKGDFIGIISVDDAKSGNIPSPETVRPLEIYAGMIAQIIILKREQVKREKLEAELRQAQKMESVGRLAGGVAHDFNNMLAVILGHAEIALDRLDPTQPTHADLQQIRLAATRSAEITRQLLAFARKQTIIPRILDLNETVAGMLKMLRRLIGEDIDLAWHPGFDLWSTKLDPSQIDQILVNLSVNARDAIMDNGHITFETGNYILDHKYCADHAGCVPGQYVRLAVSDNGQGIDRETLPHIFEPFFTTKGIGEGTGLGLATVYGIVKQNRGFINVYSEPGHGTTFTIYLPRHEGVGRQQQENSLAVPARQGDETILLVEDDPAILNMTRMMLQSLGYTVLSTGMPEEALVLAEKHAGDIALLLTDVVMPRMNGLALVEEILHRQPAIRCLFMSGYTANAITHQAILEDGVHFIEKPFSKKQLANKIREVLL